MYSSRAPRHSASLSSTVTAVGGVCALIAGLAFFDERVRLELARLLSGRAPSGEIASLSERLQDFVRVAMQAVADQSVENAPLVIFGVAALVLVLFMTRT